MILCYFQELALVNKVSQLKNKYFIYNEAWKSPLSICFIAEFTVPVSRHTH